MEREWPWSVLLRVEEVPEAGLERHLDADQAAREQIADFAELHSLPRLEADFLITRRGRGLRVVGEVSATVGQTCVVSLEALENEVTEAVDLVFEPGAGTDDETDLPHNAAGNRPEPLRNGVVDLGAITTEFLVLGIDPYPRKPGAVFNEPAPAGAEENPFAALAVLKSKADGS